MTLPAPATTIRFRRNTASGWATKNPVLASGEPAYERDTGKFKIGDGLTAWNDLAYFTTTVQQTPSGPVVGPVIGPVIVEPTGDAVMDAHIQSETPHPVYDDGPSLILLYQNAKV